MELEQTENQQIAAIKQFLRDYKKSVIFTICLAIIVVCGLRYWQYHIRQQVFQASDIYQEMVSAQNRQDMKMVEEKGQILLSGYKSTAYPQLAGLLLAKNAVDAGNFPEAEKQLNWVIGLRNAKQVTLHIAKTRLARVMLQKGDADGALKLLSAESDKALGAYLPLYEEARGDAYLAKGEKQKAKAAYFKALTTLPAGVQAQPLQIKLMDLGVVDEDNPKQNASKKGEQDA